ncbi:MAG: copper resistance protein B [Gammaproteobacteria bacterium]|nr:copper resistance protein B [Gammaproteobacteria bacterium]
MANLKKTGDYYSSQFPLQSSLKQFIQSYRAAIPEEKPNLLSAYSMMQHMRMGLYDISDVAYDAFLLNGQSNAHPWTTQVKVGDMVRLRFIDAGGSTIFHVKIPGTTLQLVSVDGKDIQPLERDHFDIAPGETYDVLVKIQKNQPYIIYAESTDTSGAAYGALITKTNQMVDYAAVQPFPIPQPMGMGQQTLSSMKMDSYKATHTEQTKKEMSTVIQDHSQPMVQMTDRDMQDLSAREMQNIPMEESRKPTTSHHTMDSMTGMDDMTMMNHSATSTANTSATTPETQYQDFRSPTVTNDPNVPVQEIKMVLSGYMNRYIWFINGIPEYEATPIIIEPGKRYRFIFVNMSMMNHPMHLHGHWMILRNGHGAYDPLVHTINVPPGARLWLILMQMPVVNGIFIAIMRFHMMSGMARLFRYSDFDENKTPSSQNSIMSSQHEMMTMPPQASASTTAIPSSHPVHLYQASYIEMDADPFDNTQEATLKSLIGYDYNKLELYSEEAEINKGVVEDANVDIFYWHLVSAFWAVKGGANYTYRPGETPYWHPGIGIEGLMPYFIDTDIRVYEHDGSLKLIAELSRDTQITNQFFIRAGIQANAATKTVNEDEIGNGINQMQYILRPYYKLSPSVTLFTELNYTQDYGQQINIDNNNDQSTHSTLLLFGISVLC